MEEETRDIAAAQAAASAASGLPLQSRRGEFPAGRV